MEVLREGKSLQKTTGTPGWGLGDGPVDDGPGPITHFQKTTLQNPKYLEHLA